MADLGGAAAGAVAGIRDVDAYEARQFELQRARQQEARQKEAAQAQMEGVAAARKRLMELYGAPTGPQPPLPGQASVPMMQRPAPQMSPTPPGGPGTAPAPTLPPYRAFQRGTQMTPTPVSSQFELAPKPQRLDLQSIVQGAPEKPEAYRAYMEAMMPYLSAQEKERVAQAKLQREQMTPFMREAAKVYGEGTPEYDRVVKQHLARLDVLPSYALPDTSAGQLTDKGRAVEEEFVRAGKTVPKTRRGEVDYRLLNFMGEHEEGGAGSGYITGAQAEYKADAVALGQISKDLTAIRPFKTMLDTNIDVAIDLGKKVVKSNSKLANRSINWVKQNVGDNPDTNEYLAQIAFVQTEAARVLNNPRLVGQLTDSARHEMQDVVDGNMPIKSTERVLRRIQKDGENRVAAMEKERANLLRPKPSDKPKLSDEDKEAVAWAKKNPNDPRAKQILKMHGM